MRKTALVIMAAGIGSRFGKGIKQLEPVGPSGEIIMDYSIYDALEAGFNKVVFIIRRDLEKDFKEIIGRRIEKVTEVEYAFQELDDLPHGFKKPEGRVRPWGTGQAVLVCRKLLSEPFAVINADDYYGKEAFVKVHDYLVQEREYKGKLDICMAGFILGNTLSDNGAVTRGICHLNGEGQLTGITETRGIIKTSEGAAVLQEDESLVPVATSNLASMNMWGMMPDFLDVLEEGFVDFLKALPPGDLKQEYLLPIIIDKLLQEGRAEVQVLRTGDNWFGVTYQEDKALVVQAFARLIRQGVYQKKLFP